MKHHQDFFKCASDAHNFARTIGVKGKLYNVNLPSHRYKYMTELCSYFNKTVGAYEYVGLSAFELIPSFTVDYPYCFAWNTQR